jgi:tetratricopeptide (TPR) repeat protein
MKLCRRSSVVTATAVLISACALGPLQPDLSARAPDLAGFGEVQLPITTRSTAAQRWFTQGVLQAYAFNEVEAVRMFKAALAQDPNCALCAWGVAWQLGPNINNRSRSNVPEALRYLDLALRNAPQASASERALIDALALRYGHGSQAKAARDMAPLLAERCAQGKADDEDDFKPDPLDIAYAERMRDLSLAAPQEAHVMTLWAEAEMIATRGDWWKGGANKPAGRIGELATALERGLAQQPQHIGLNHYLIHAVDDTAVAQRAVAAANRLGALAPASPHLVHMPSHTYSHIGRYADATLANENAMAAEAVLMDKQKAQGFTVSKDWRNHNQHFLWFAALMEGRGDVAVAAAREIAGRAAKADHVFADYQRSLPLLAMLRLQRWDAVLAEPTPDSKHGLAQALSEQARGVALLRAGGPTALVDARAALLKAESGSAAITNKHTAAKGFDRLLRDMAGSAVDGLRAEIALAEGRAEDALTLQAQALEQAKRVDDSEPPLLGAGARLSLGNMQLRVGRAALAEASFRSDLAEQPNSGWALKGLQQALQAQGKTTEARALQVTLAKSWPQADAALR